MDEIYKRIRNLRKQQGYTLKEMSARTGLSVSFLSQVERGTTSLAITSLKMIADALEVPITDFFETQTIRNFVVKEEEQEPFRIEGSSSEYIRLSGSFPGRLLEPVIVTLDPEAVQNSALSHPGEEYYYVLEGAIIFNVEGKEYLVKKGDSIHFPSNIIHYWTNPLKQRSSLLCVKTPVIF